MEFRSDRRAQSVQVGAAILLAFVVIAISLYQAQVVPQQNQQVEFNHNQLVQGQMQEVRNGVVSVPGGGNGRSVTVKLGTTYPERTIFVNPDRPSGQLRTGPAGPLRIENATATGEAGDFWTGANRTYSTKALAYRPNYNEYDRAPVTVYENTVVYDVSTGATLAQSDQRLIDGRRITLATLNGSYQAATSDAVSVDLRATSTSDNVVTVSNDTDPVTITLPTRLPEGEWRDLLSGEFAPDGHVLAVSTTDVAGQPFDLLHVRLEAGVEYSLRMAKVGVGSGVTDTEAAYLTDVEGDGERVATGANVTLIAEVRDRFNNPVAGELVNASVVSGPGSVRPANETSDSDGRVEFTYTASGAGTAVVEANVSTAPDESERVNFTVTVTAGGRGGAYSVFWRDPSGQSGTESCDAVDCTLDAGESTTLRLTAATDPVAQNATVEYAVGNSTVATVSPATDTTDASGENTTTLTARANGTVQVYAASGGSGDVINVTVTGFGTGGPSSGDDVSYVGGSAGADTFSTPGSPTSDTGSLEFSIENTGSSSATVTGFEIEEAGSATVLESDFTGGCQFEQGKDDLYLDASADGCADRGAPRDYDVGTTYPLTANATLAAGTTADLSLYQFQDAAGNPVSVSGETVRIVLYFADGSTTTIEFTAP